MVNPESRLYRLHPETGFNVTKRGRFYGRNQYILDMSRWMGIPGECLDTLLVGNDISYWAGETGLCLEWRAADCLHRRKSPHNRPSSVRWWLTMLGGKTSEGRSTKLGGGRVIMESDGFRLIRLVILDLDRVVTRK